MYIHGDEVVDMDNEILERASYLAYFVQVSKVGIGGKFGMIRLWFC